jgi:predicted NUDIX family phosphoesterase
VYYYLQIIHLIRKNAMSEIERVLVIERRVLEELGIFQGVSTDIDKYLPRLWNTKSASFMARNEAEKDPSYKQLIPYVIMSYRDEYLCYIRGKGVDETRLSDRVSIGIGGHINPSDETSLSSENLKETYFNALVREVSEEVILETQHDDKIVGLINDDSNEVGQVHLGIVHFWRLESQNVKRREQEISQLRFMKINELQQMKDRMETWSRLCLDSLGIFNKIASMRD